MSSRVVEHSESESDSEVTFTSGALEPGNQFKTPKSLNLMSTLYQ